MLRAALPGFARAAAATTTASTARSLALSRAAAATTPVSSFPLRGTPTRTLSVSAARMAAALTPIKTDSAPAAIGPYSQAMVAGNMLFVSGQIPLTPGGELIEDLSIEGQTKQVLTNLKAVLEAGGSDMSHVVKTSVFLTSMDDFAAMNAVYQEFFKDHAPARAAVEVSRLPKDKQIRVEIECVALLKA